MNKIKIESALSKSFDFKDNNISRLREIFPEVFLDNKIDFEYR